MWTREAADYEIQVWNFTYADEISNYSGCLWHDGCALLEFAEIAAAEAKQFVSDRESGSERNYQNIVCYYNKTDNSE